MTHTSIVAVKSRNIYLSHSQIQIQIYGDPHPTPPQGSTNCSIMGIGRSNQSRRRWRPGPNHSLSCSLWHPHKQTPGLNHTGFTPRCQIFIISKYIDFNFSQRLWFNLNSFSLVKHLLLYFFWLKAEGVYHVFLSLVKFHKDLLAFCNSSSLKNKTSATPLGSVQDFENLALDRRVWYSQETGCSKKLLFKSGIPSSKGMPDWVAENPAGKFDIPTLATAACTGKQKKKRGKSIKTRMSKMVW